MSFQGYADHLVIFAPAAEDLKVLLGRTEKLRSDHELMINVAKTKIFVFKSIGRALKFGFSFDNRREQIESVDVYIYIYTKVQIIRVA